MTVGILPCPKFCPWYGVTKCRLLSTYYVIFEQGVGRDKNYEITFKADQRDGGGGDYYTTYWAQPTFVSSRLYYAHFDTTTYSELDFRADDFHEIQIWGDSPSQFHFFTGSSYIELLEGLTGYLGRQSMPPEWIYNGTILGVQGGTEAMLNYIQMAEVSEQNKY